ncbi:transposase [Bacillus sp. JJ1521]
MKLDRDRHVKIKDFLHKVSFNIVKIAQEHQIDTIVIGKNKEWKQNSHLGKKNNQKFVQIPHALLIGLITYKANAKGIAVIVTEESYTSKASFLDGDYIPTFKMGNKETHIFSGKRIHRGLYRSKHNILINADVNGAANILKKVVPKAFANGIAAVCSQPLVVNVL